MFGSNISSNNTHSIRIILTSEAETIYSWSNLISDGLIVMNEKNEIVFVNKVYKTWLGVDELHSKIKIPLVTDSGKLTNFLIGGQERLFDVKVFKQDAHTLLFIKDLTQIQEQKAQIIQYEHLFGRIMQNLPFGLLHVRFHSKKHIEFINANQQFYAATTIGINDDLHDMVTVLQRLNPDIIAYLEQTLLYKNYKSAEIFKIQNNQILKLIGIPDGKDQIIILIENITAQLEADAYSKKNEQRLMLVQRATSDGLADFDFEHNDLYLSPRFYSMLGFQENVFAPTPENWYKLVHPDDQKEIVNTGREEVIKGKSFFRVEIRMKTNTGQWRWVLVRGQVVKRDKKGMPLRLVGTHQDITTQKEQNQQLKDQENKLKRFINNIDGMVYRCAFDNNWTMLFVSEGVRQLTGYSVEEMLKNNTISYNDIIDARDSQMVRDVITGYAGTQKVFDIVYRIRTKTEQLKWVHERGSFVIENGKISHIEGVILDITTEKQAELEKSTSDKKFKTYIANAPDGIIVVDRDQMVVEFNPTAMQMLEYQGEQMYNQPFTMLTHGSPDELRTFFKLMHEVGQATVETRMKSRFNKIFYAMISGVRLPNRQYLLFVKDINIRKNTELQLQQKNKEFKELNNSYIEQNELLLKINQEIKDMNNELRVAKNKAEESEQLKSAFLANMSHEIRTPMNGILGFSRLLINPHLSDDKRERYISVIEKSGDQLLALINNILDISKIETDQVKINFEKLNFHSFFEDIFARFSNDAARNGIDLLLEVPDHPASIQTDPIRLNQIFTNLITNALKFTEKGYIRLGYTVEQSKIVCFVQDTGQGIPPDQQERIFERFQQVDTSYNHTRGTGLGLAIARGLLKLLGGKISVQSAIGEGSTFIVEFPLVKEQPQNRIKESADN